MLDDENGDFVGTAVREVEEETGIKLNLEGMVDLTALLDPATGCRILPSPGGCDEEIGLFLYRGHVDEETIRLAKGRKRASGTMASRSSCVWSPMTSSGARRQMRRCSRQ
uniref:Nudix hydrolase 14, chloroplastic n=1 Tax=Triticum urartu TaxID=4572 RepID=A0A8R7TNA0_TRIUA